MEFLEESLEITTMFQSLTPTLEPGMLFGEENLLTIIVYSVLFIIAAGGNLTVFITLLKSRCNRNRSRIGLLVMNLSVADLIVTFIMMPLEIVWAWTVTWDAGDLACRVLMFGRAFGLYLSSYILIVISIDRYYAVVHPLRNLKSADRRAKVMLVIAWLLSVCSSAPQSFIFHLEEHPDVPGFTQCVTYNAFPNPSAEISYNMFNILAIYLVPLVVIIVSYAVVLCVLYKKSGRTSVLQGNGTRNGCRSECNGNMTEMQDLKAGSSSSTAVLKQAKSHTLKMTVVIVLVFIFCWTPYYIMSTWWWFAQSSAAELNVLLQKCLLMFAVSNSCVNPIVYGMFSVAFRRAIKRSWSSRSSKTFTRDVVTSPGGQSKRYSGCPGGPTSQTLTKQPSF